MIRWWALALAGLLLTACGQRAEHQRLASPAIWAIDDADGRPVGWLFGTVHALPPGVDWRTPTLEHALGRAGVLAVEVANLRDEAAIARIFERLATDHPGPPLAERLDPVTRGRLASLLDRDHVPRGRYDRLETWAAALAIAQLEQTSDVQQGVDRALLAEFAGRPLVELEGAQAQLGLFDALPSADQRDLLEGVLDESEQPAEERERLARAWAGGDQAALESLVREGILADPDLREVLLIRRNRRWADAIGELLAAGRRPFVAVGAAHMLGSQGLPALLAAKGFAVRRIQ